MNHNIAHIFPPPFTGEGDREAVEGAAPTIQKNRCPAYPLRFAALSSSPVNGGGKG
jgi:hypothetical protein